MSSSRIIESINYGELADNDEVVDACENLKNNLNEVEKVLENLLPLKAQYDKMSVEDKIELDLFLAYALNSLHWVHLRIQGVDPLEHPIKGELERIKAAMIKWQQYKDEKKRPTLDIEAAKRFVKSGLYDRSQSGEPPNKKIRFSEDTEDE